MTKNGYIKDLIPLRILNQKTCDVIWPRFDQEYLWLYARGKQTYPALSGIAWTALAVLLCNISLTRRIYKYRIQSLPEPSSFPHRLLC